jgi:hypothetical protein
MIPSITGTPAAPFEAPLSPITLLKNIIPPEVVIHIGAGTGNGGMHAWQRWDVPCALIIDADSERLNWAAPLTETRPNWQVLTATLSREVEDVDYYHATNPAEDGLLPPDRLAVLWPNLRTATTSKRRTERLDALISEWRHPMFSQASSIWTIIDCLPALPILQGAGSEIKKWSFLWLRVLLQPVDAIDDGATLPAIEAFLRPFGFRCIHVIECNHPAMGEALFTRDCAALLEQIDLREAAHLALQADLLDACEVRDEQSLRAIEARSCIDALARERDGHAQTTSACQNELKVGAQSIAELRHKIALQETVHGALQADIETLCKARDSQAQLAAEAVVRTESLTQDRDRLSRALATKQEQLDALTHACTALLKKGAVQEAGRMELQTALADSRRTGAEHARNTTDALARIDALMLDRDSHAQTASGLRAELEVLIQARAELSNENALKGARCDALQTELANMRKTSDDQTRLANEARARVDALTLERDGHALASSACHAELKALIQTGVELANEHALQGARCLALQGELASVCQTRDEQARLINEACSRNDALTLERDSHAQAASAFQAELNALTQARAELSNDHTVQGERCFALQAELATMRQTRDDQARLASEASTRIDALTLERDALVLASSARHAELEALIQTGAELGNEHALQGARCLALQAELASMCQARDEQTRLASEASTHVDALTLERDALVLASSARHSELEALIQTGAELANEHALQGARCLALQAELASMCQARDEQTRLASEASTRVDALTLERDALVLASSARHAELEALIQTGAELANEHALQAARCLALQAELASMCQARDEQTRLASEARSCADAITHERDGHAQRATDLQVELGAVIDASRDQARTSALQEEKLTSLQAETATLALAGAEQTQQIAVHRAELDLARIELGHKDTRIVELDSLLAERDHRQQQLKEELIKAEAQIELIKDVLLREPGL